MDLPINEKSQWLLDISKDLSTTIPVPVLAGLRVRSTILSRSTKR